jgi:hypothetical protein
LFVFVFFFLQAKLSFGVIHIVEKYLLKNLITNKQTKTERQAATEPQQSLQYPASDLKGSVGG